MTHEDYSDSLIRGILQSVNVIATVGASANWVRPSYFAMKYLQAKGFRVIPVNPTQTGAEILGEQVYARLGDIPEPVDMVQVFRRGEEVGPITADAIAIGAKVLWMQIGIRNDEAARQAEAAGLTVIMNRCPKIEYARLFGELGWSGINTGVISSKRRPIGKR